MSRTPQKRKVSFGDPLAPVQAEQAKPPAKEERKPDTTMTRTSFAHPVEDGNRARAAYAWTHLEEGHRTYSDFVNYALMKEVKRLEKKYNADEAFKGGSSLPSGRKPDLG